MTCSALRIVCLIGASALLAGGCTSMDRESSMREKITKDADPAFLKRVKNDPFPAAGQAPKVAANRSGSGDDAESEVTTSCPTVSLPTNVSGGRPTVTASTGRSGTIQTAAGPFNPSGGANGANTNGAASNRTAISRPNSGLSSNNVRFGAGGTIARNNVTATAANRSNEIEADAFASDADETSEAAPQSARRGTTSVRRN